MLMGSLAGTLSPSSGSSSGPGGTTPLGMSSGDVKFSGALGLVLALSEAERRTLPDRGGGSEGRGGGREDRGGGRAGEEGVRAGGSEGRGGGSEDRGGGREDRGGGGQEIGRGRR